MYVVKRDGRKESVKFDKITARVKKLCYGLNSIVDPTVVAMKVIEGVYEGVTTSALDNLAAETADDRPARGVAVTHVEVHNLPLLRSHAQLQPGALK